jgi:hypothetical protein
VTPYSPEALEGPSAARQSRAKIINIRGTSGSGKSTLVRKFLDTYHGQALRGPDGRIRGYVCRAQSEYGLQRDVYIVGSYEIPTGGCDGLKTQDEICDRVREFAALGDVIYEGLLISGLFRRYNALAEELTQHHHIFGFLDTPLQKCIDQTLSRRALRAAVNGKIARPFDPNKTLTPKYHAIASCRAKFINARKDVRDIPHERAFETLVAWFSTDDWEPDE